MVMLVLIGGQCRRGLANRGPHTSDLQGFQKMKVILRVLIEGVPVVRISAHHRVLIAVHMAFIVMLYTLRPVDNADGWVMIID